MSTDQPSSVAEDAADAGRPLPDATSALLTAQRPQPLSVAM